jgi:hypothetical protein
MQQSIDKCNGLCYNKKSKQAKVTGKALYRARAISLCSFFIFEEVLKNVF